MAKRAKRYKSFTIIEGTRIEILLQKLDFKQKESCKVFSINEVADMLKVSKRTIEGHLYDKRDLPYLKIGRKVRITKSDLESFLGLVS